MTAREFREVDHDLLADYVGGALAGTPDEVTVARLVDEDPAWAQAYAELAPAVALVRADLTAWAEPAPEMPLAVLDRLTAALAGAGPAAPADATLASTDRVGHDARPTPPGVPAQAGGAARRTGGSRPDDGRADAAGPGRRRRRWSRLAGPVALAAASLMTGGIGIGQLLDRSGTEDTAATTMAGPSAEDAAAPFRLTTEPGRSGTDWTPETLVGGASRSALPKAASAGPGPQPGVGSVEGAPDRRRPAFAGGLDRLSDRGALDVCLAEISAEHGRGPVTVDLVDYASFRGEPALVVRFADPSGEHWTWVTGAECGVPGSGADTRWQARVG
ncbi:hypothetical protein [Micromonospora psammae]|uniref:hypothetical protein n=1 Tax=Micromonospora sp. CPCC 205556 TaxID=3122398 RepID=UPI002FF3408F